MLGPSARAGCGWRSSISPSTAAASASASISIRAGSSSSSRRAGWSSSKPTSSTCIDQAITILGAGHDIKCMFTTPKLLESLALALEDEGTSIRKAGITGIFSGGTEFTPQWTRFAHEELLDGAYMTPTYGNTLMGLAASSPSRPHDNYKITYYAPQPRAVDRGRRFRRPDQDVDYGETGRVKLTTLTQGVLHARASWSATKANASRRATSTLGRRQRRAPVPRPGCHNDGRRVLMIHLPVLRWGQPIRAGSGRRGPLFNRRADREGQPGQWRPHQARHAQGAPGARRAPRDLDRRADRTRRQGGRALYERHAADGRRHAVAGRVRQGPVGQHRPARAHVPRQHDEE